VVNAPAFFSDEPNSNPARAYKIFILEIEGIAINEIEAYLKILENHSDKLALIKKLPETLSSWDLIFRYPDFFGLSTN
jgi:hypothetical protein